MTLPDPNEKWDARFVTANKNAVVMVLGIEERWDLTVALYSSILRRDCGIGPPQLVCEIRDLELFAQYILGVSFQSKSKFHSVICGDSHDLFLTAISFEFLHFNRATLLIAV
jgi:hypothetical protein